METFKVPLLPTNEKDELSINSSDNETVPDKLSVSEIKKLANNSYKSPSWSALPPDDVNYSFEVLKSGQIINTTPLNSQSFWRFGRLPENEIEMAHPTISRFHAVLQYGTKSKNDNAEDGGEENSGGWYIYDLNSTHGTYLNKQRIPPNVFLRVRVGHMLRFGSSTRMYILQGPIEDEEPASELSITEIKQQAEERRNAAIVEKQLKADKHETEGISWGMQEDADEESDLAYNPYAITSNEEMYVNDPKRVLRTFFENEGLDLQYDCNEMSAGTFVCRVMLPIDDTNGRSLAAEVVHKGRKKDCVLQCALEACRMLDRCGLLNKRDQEKGKRKMISNQNDSDEDEFLDRTGDVQRKKLKKEVPKSDSALSFEDLSTKEEDLLKELNEIEKEINEYMKKQERLKTKVIENADDDDVLDNFMNNLNNDDTKLDKTRIRKLRIEQQRLTTEREKIEKLKKFCKSSNSLEKEDTAKTSTSSIAKRNQFYKFSYKNSMAPVKGMKLKEKEQKTEEEEIEEEEKEEKDEEEQQEEEGEDEKNYEEKEEGQIEENPEIKQNVEVEAK